MTGSRVSRAAKAQQRVARRMEMRGAWNACTVDDPRQDLTACRSALPTTAPGAAGQAKALVAEGVTKAWRDDLDGAVFTFDRAIAASPKLGEAWLNRGLAHVRAGEDAAALGDFDKAVRYAPRDARGWFHRSLVLRRQGKIARADDDAERAIALDPSYERLID